MGYLSTAAKINAITALHRDRVQTLIDDGNLSVGRLVDLYVSAESRALRRMPVPGIDAEFEAALAAQAEARGEDQGTSINGLTDAALAAVYEHSSDGLAAIEELCIDHGLVGRSYCAICDTDTPDFGAVCAICGSTRKVTQ